jgi:RNA polymerase sigma-70 factor (ECF subfamily)
VKQLVETAVPDSPAKRDDNAAIAEAMTLLRSGGKARERGVRELYDRFFLKFQRYFQRHRIPAAHAEELVQEVFIRVLKGCESYRGEAAPAVWLWTIVRNAMVSYHRARKSDVESDAGEPGENDAPLEQSMEETPPWVRECLARQMKQFGMEHPERAECLSTIVLQDWGIEELAHFLGRSIAATKEYLSQCRKKLRTYLRQCVESEDKYGLR